jgi:uncharacterized tellurite resistance protein B-like protein
MNANINYQLGLLYLVHLLISSDGVIDDNEMVELLKVKNAEKIPDSIFNDFAREIASKKERDIYQKGIGLINKCSDEEKLEAFVHLYKMSEVDGKVHAKEVRLMLYSIKKAKLEFSDVVERASQKKSS